MSTRREFLKKAGTSVLAASALGTVATQLPLEAQNTNNQYDNASTIIAVYLRGGADMLGIVVPYGDRNYYRHHPTISVPGPDSTGANKALFLDNIFGFNPNMRALHNMYQKGMCAPIVCAGSPHPTRSHFDAQDFMERGAPGLRTIASGWLNRYLQESRSVRDANLRAVSLQSLLPRSLRGQYPVLAKPDQRAELAMSMYNKLYMNAPTKGKKGASTPEISPDMATSGTQTKQVIEALGARTIEQLRELTEILEKSPPATAAYPNSGFARQMRDIAKIIKARRGLEATALDYGGWDHHINEGTINGQLANRIGDVSNTIGAFFDDLGPQLTQKVLVLVMTEFGRTTRENANAGTDHGHGSFMLAVGGRVAGKKVYGKWVGLADNQLNEGRDLPVFTDFRLVFAEALKGMFNFDGIKLQIFPDYTPDRQPLNLMKNV